jgi:hypothetical protein
MKTMYVWAVLLAATAALAGCGPPGTVKEESIEVKQQVALDEAKRYLENYAKGQPLGSEVSEYERIVAEVKQSDPERGATLEKGFAELQRKGTNTAAKAKELLRQLAPRQGP